MSKQCRALQRSGWEKDAAAVLRLAAASDKLVQLYLEVRRRSWFGLVRWLCFPPRLCCRRPYTKSVLPCCVRFVFFPMLLCCCCFRYVDPHVEKDGRRNDLATLTVHTTNQPTFSSLGRCRLSLGSINASIENAHFRVTRSIHYCSQPNSVCPWFRAGTIISVPIVPALV